MPVLVLLVVITCGEVINDDGEAIDEPFGKFEVQNRAECPPFDIGIGQITTTFPKPLAAIKFTPVFAFKGAEGQVANTTGFVQVLP